MLILAASIVASLGASASPTAAQHWPSFRGPNGRGIGTGAPPIIWNVQTGENVKWRTDIPGLAHSSPIVWGDRVYVTTAIPASMDSPTLDTGWIGGSGESAADSGEWTWALLCLDRSTGEIVWKRDAHTGEPTFKRHLKASHANCTPATDGKHVVAFFGSEGLFCYDTNGELRWKKDLGPLDSGPYNAPGLQWGFASSPIIHGNKVIVQCDALNIGFWASFDLETGNEIRRVERKDVSTWSTPAIHESETRTQIVCNGWKHMGAYDLNTGEELWKLSGGGDVPVPTPQVTDDLIVLTNGHGRSPIYVISPDARGDLTPKDGNTPDGLLWHRKGGGSYMPTPLIYGKGLYIADDRGIVYAVDARTGERAFRARVGEGKSTFSASAVAADGRIYLTGEDGSVYVIRAGDEFELLATNEMGEVCMATPAISNGELFIRTAGRLYCLSDGAKTLMQPASAPAD